MKRRKMIVTLVVCLALILMTSGVTSAHEIYYHYQAGTSGNPLVGINLKWSITTNGKAYLKINADYLQSVYSTQLSSVYNTWQTSCPSEVVAVMWPVSSSNVDLGTKTQTEWNNKWGSSANYVLAYTVLKSTDNVYVTSVATAEQCSKSIKYANIYFNPSVSAFGSTQRALTIKRTLVHELGHVLCLGHPNGNYYTVSDASVMRTGYNMSDAADAYYVPQTHDKNDISQKY